MCLLSLDNRRVAGRPQGSISQSFAALDRLALLYLGVGAFAYFVMLRVVAGIPSATAFVGPLGSLIMVGACLRLWVARESRNRLKLWSTLALLPVLPLATVIQHGFIGFRHVLGFGHRDIHVRSVKAEGGIFFARACRLASSDFRYS